MKLEFAPSSKPIDISPDQWSSWTWQLQKSAKTQSDFSQALPLSSEEEKAFAQGSDIFNIRSTPYYLSLISKTDLQDPLRKIVMPTASELLDGKQSLLDPLGEKANNPVPRIIHRYSDRVLFLVTDVCSVYCRFCTRKHFTGQEQAFIKEDEFQKAIDYIKAHKGLREVILSGGDPLTISDQHLDRTLSALRAIEHVEIIRIGSRMPVVCPMRMTDNLVSILKKHKPVFLMTHFNHPRELTFEAAQALEKCVDNGVPVFNQMVLLNGVNNHPAIVQALSRRLLYLRVKPYYMFQCDPSEGTDHLRTSIDDSLMIQKELWGHLSGLAMPNFSVDIPQGGGKAYYTPKFEVGADEVKRTYIGWDGVEAEYINPSAANILKPSDANLYQAEWLQLKDAKK